MTHLPALLILSHVADFRDKVLKVFVLSEASANVALPLAALKSAGSVLFHVSVVMAMLFNMVERAATVAVAWKPERCLPNCGLHTSNAECAYSARGLPRYCLSVCQRAKDALLLPLMRNHNYHVVMGIKWMQWQGHYERVFRKLMQKLAFLDLVLDLIHLCAVTVDACMIYSSKNVENYKPMFCIINLLFFSKKHIHEHVCVYIIAV